MILVFSSCLQVEPLTVNSVACCNLIKAFKSETEITFEVEMENRNSFPITVKSYDLTVRLNGNNIGNASTKDPTLIPANSAVSESVSITTSTKKLISGTLLMGLNSLMKNDPTTLDIEVVGSVVGKAKGVSKRVRIKEKYPLKMQP